MEHLLGGVAAPKIYHLLTEEELLGESSVGGELYLGEGYCSEFVVVELRAQKKEL